MLKVVQQLFSLEIMQNCLIRLFFVLLYAPINLKHVFTMSAFNTHAYFDSCSIARHLSMDAVPNY